MKEGAISARKAGLFWGLSMMKSTLQVRLKYSRVTFDCRIEKSWVLFLSIYQKHLTLLVTRTFLISCRLMELSIRSLIGLLIICFLEHNQSNSKVLCQMPIPYFLEFHREVYWDRYCLLSVLMMCIYLFTQPQSSLMRMIH